MKEYRVKGLSCGNCTLDLERQLQKLDYGDSTTLSYTTGKLKLDPRVSLSSVERILKIEHAFIDKSFGMAAPSSEGDHHTCSTSDRHTHNHDHGHAHDHAHDPGHDHAHSHDNSDHDHSHSHAHGNAAMMTLLLISAIIYSVTFIAGDYFRNEVSVSLYLIATVMSGYSTFFRGLRNLSKLRFNIDTLMTIALIGAVAIEEWKEAALVAILFGLNEWLEGLGMEKARRSMEALLKVAPSEAIKLEDGVELIVPIAALQPGDLVIVKPGGKIPSDGIVEEGRSSVNEAAITGESMPVEKSPGEAVFGGTLNNDGIIRVRILKAYTDSSLAAILHLVEEAQETKTPTELFINRFARYYTPIIMAVSALVIVIPPLFFSGDWNKWLYQGLAVLIVGCPCALILSSPIAIVSGITRNARHGILVKGGVFLEQLGRIDTLAFDKTGTLTKGEPHVVKSVVYDKEQFLAFAGAIEKTSSHPLAKAIMKEISLHPVQLPEVDEMQTISGCGIMARIHGKSYSLGNEESVSHINLSSENQAAINSLKEEGLTLVLLADNERLLGIFGIQDEIRAESKAVIGRLHHIGIRRTVMLTGDHQKTAEKVAAIVGVTDFYSNLLPEDKVNKIKELSRQGHQVAMIGDGINDSPALASAKLGIAMGKGTDSAIETADIVLMQDHLGKLPEAITVAKKVNRTIRFNISIALALKIIALLLTIPGWLTLWIAILSDMGATVLVTLISLTILIDPRRN
ncbi:heavy metal translocating P-type ATPase [Paenibacillus solisilvae]|uniref:Cd(2+)-exporting ATPase n=1 Tax=Paenibacillus solisilvae TaxID=2486751 RepID=A0ABW0VXU9_9BACL